MERVVNIIGLGASAKNVPEDGENWVLNVAYKHLQDKKVHKMFFMDNFDNIMKDDALMMGDYTFDKFILNNPEVEIISRKEDIIKHLDGNVLAKVKEYPFNDVLFLSNSIFFTSTIAYTLCYAILQKVDRIRLYGLELWAGSDANEYHYQRPCVDFWIAFAMGRGIKIDVPYMLMQQISNNQNCYGYISGDLKQNYRR